MRQHWRKLHRSWWESISHRGLSPHAHAVGLFLMTYAQDPDEDGVGWCVHADGTPVGWDDFRTMTGSRKVRDWARSVQCLAQVGTIFVRPLDQAIGFPNYAKHQESPGVRRMRKHRAERHSDEKVTGEAEAEAEAEAEKKKRDAFGYTEVIAALSAARKEIGLGAVRDTPARRDLIRKANKKHNATIDDWRQVIAAQLENVRGNVESHKYLRLSTIVNQFGDRLDDSTLVDMLATMDYDDAPIVQGDEPGEWFRLWNNKRYLITAEQAQEILAERPELAANGDDRMAVGQ